MNYLPEWPNGCLGMTDDGTGRYVYYMAGFNGGYDIWTKASKRAKLRFHKNVKTKDEVKREMEKFMENF